MRRNTFPAQLILIAASLAAIQAPAGAATIGKAVPIGGQATDIALDEPSGLLYVANFTANRVDKVRLADLSVSGSISVAARPNAVAVSGGGQYLLVGHYGNAGSSTSNLITSVQLSSGARQTFVTGDPPLGIAFTGGNQALVVTSKTIYLYSADSGTIRTKATFAGLSGDAMPAKELKFPQQITSAACAASGTNQVVWCVGNAGLTTPSVVLRYDANNDTLATLLVPSVPALLPRVSVNQDGSRAMIGYAMFSSDFTQGTIVAQYPDPLETATIGGHALNSAKGILYAQIFDASQPAAPPYTNSKPTLAIMDADNLTVRERIYIPESLTGRGLVTSDGKTMFAISESGVLALPVGTLEQQPRLIVSTEDIHARAAACDRNVISKPLLVVDPGGGATDFTIVSNTNGVSVSPTYGRTPQALTVRIDPVAFQNATGTTVATLTITSPTAVNQVKSVRVLVSNPGPDQRGAIVNQPGKLVDVAADGKRNLVYALRQDTNQLLVFDGTSFAQLAAFRTATTPTRMSFSADGRYALVGHDNSQLVTVYDVDAMQQMPSVGMPLGHYPRSLAVSNADTLALSRVAQAISPTGGLSGCVGCVPGPSSGTVTRVDWVNRVATDFASLGIWENSVPAESALAGSPNGRTVVLASADGNIKLYSADARTFTAARKDFTELAGPLAASDYGTFVVGSYLLNSSLVPQAVLDASSGTPSGFAFFGEGGFRVSGGTAGTPGVIENYASVSSAAVKPVRMAEAPLPAAPGAQFPRTVAPLAAGTNVVALTTSGFTALAWSYDAATAPPSIAAVTNAADGARPVAPGGLVSIWGQQMSPLSLATRQIPLPTALAESCVVVNGTPIPLLFVSNYQVNAQLPYNVTGSAVMQILTPGGASDYYYFSVSPAAPAVFRSGVAGPDTNIATIVRYSNGQLVTNTNPVHPKDVLTIYLEGMGATNPAVETGQAAPSAPLAWTSVQPQVSLGGVPLEVSYSGLTPGSVGLYQINATVPYNAPEGSAVPLTIVQGSGSTQLAVRVVK